MPRATIDPTERIERIGNALNGYVEAIRILEWLSQNNLLAANMTEEARQKLAYQYAVYYNKHRNQIEAIINAKER